MKFLTLLSLLIIVSCGKNTETTLIENKYDDSKIIAQSKLQDARIQSLEGRINEINQVLDSMLNSDDVQDMINDKYDDLDNYLIDLENRLNNEIPTVINVCNTKEVLFKFYDGFYALFMLSNNMESYLSKLDENVTYQTTDALKRKFKIVNNNLVCL